MEDELLQYLKKLTIVCVEDDDLIRQRLVATLRYYFAHVYEASDGESGFEIYYEKSPDVVLTDIQMPRSSGIELVQNIRYDDKQTRIIVLTAHSQEEYLMSLINLGINHFIKKPINSEKLHDAFYAVFEDEIENEMVLIDGCVLYPQSHELEYLGQCIQLRKRESDFLSLLYKNRVLSYSIIEDALWEGKFMTQGALKTFIKELRQKLPVDILQNLPGEGYMLKR